jgi:hypothetical protein
VFGGAGGTELAAVGLALGSAAGYGVLEQALILGPPVLAEERFADGLSGSPSAH